MNVKTITGAENTPIIEENRQETRTVCITFGYIFLNNVLMCALIIVITGCTERRANSRLHHRLHIGPPCNSLFIKTRIIEDIGRSLNSIKKETYKNPEVICISIRLTGYFKL